MPAPPEDVRGRRVIGVLPMHLAVLAACVVEVPLVLTREDREAMQRGDLSIERIRATAGRPVTYVVRTERQFREAVEAGIDVGHHSETRPDVQDRARYDRAQATIDRLRTGGHIRLAWLALLVAVALLLAAPVAVADPPTATVPDAGVKAKPRQPTHWERWPQGGPRGGAGDEPIPSTGDKAG